MCSSFKSNLIFASHSVKGFMQQQQLVSKVSSSGLFYSCIFTIFIPELSDTSSSICQEQTDRILPEKLLCISSMKFCELFMFEFHFFFSKLLKNYEPIVKQYRAQMRLRYSKQKHPSFNNFFFLLFFISSLNNTCLQLT